MMHAPRSSFLTVLLCVGGLGLFVVGCDSNGDGGSSETQNQAPTAEISLDNRNGLIAAFSGAGSTDPDGEITSFEWSFGDDSTDAEETVVHEYDADGTYPVELVVTDDDGASDSTGMDVMVSRTPTAFDVTLENVGSVTPITKSGAFTPADENPTVDNNAGPLRPGEAFQFSFTVGQSELPGTGMALSFASMFVQSNDAYYAFGPGGLALFDEGDDPDTNRDDTPIGMDGAVDVTDQVNLYDAGTEIDQEPGTGDNQAPRQGSLNQGPDENGVVTRIENIDSDPQLEDDANGNGQLDNSNNEFEYPATSDVLSVTVSSEMDSQTGSIRFTVTIENTGGATTVNGAPFVISPGTFAAHFDQTPGGDEVAYPGHNAGTDMAASPGIEAIAEDGRPNGALPDDDGTPAGNHLEALSEATGVTVPLSPGAFAAHTDEIEAFASGESASPGVEAIAEDGWPGTLADELDDSNSGIRNSGVFDSPDGTDSTRPIAPGNSYSFTVEALPGDRLTFVTMYIQSNDLFYAFPAEGLPLFTNNAPINGDMTGQVLLYDAGTEGDQEPGTGLDQAPRQSGDNTGPSGEGSVVRVGNADDDRFLDDDGFDYAETQNILRVTITPRN